MQNSRWKLAVLFLFALCAAPTFSAHAQVILSQTLDTSTPIPSSSTDWSSSLSFPQFNSSLGTLSSVQLNLSGSFQTQLTIVNFGPSPSSGNATTQVQMTLQDAALHLNAPELTLISPAYDFSIPAYGSVISGPLTQSGLYAGTYTLPAVLLEFTGTSSIVLPASTFTQTILTTSGGNTTATQITTASLTGSVTYSYTVASVPEPASLSLFVAAVAILATRRRHRL